VDHRHAAVRTTAVESSGQRFRRVDDDDVARLQQFRKVMEHAMFHVDPTVGRGPSRARDEQPHAVA
jgi:hypothetical protein